MKQATRLKIILIFCLAGINSACSHQTIPLQTIYSSNNCAINEQRLKPVNSASELDDLLKSFPKSLSKTAAPSLQVDYQKQSLILFALGKKPTGGYAIELDRSTAILKGKKLYLPIRIVQPDKDSFQIQLITSPCKIFSIPKTEFTEIHIGS